MQKDFPLGADQQKFGPPDGPVLFADGWKVAWEALGWGMPWRNYYMRCSFKSRTRKRGISIHWIV